MNFRGGEFSTGEMENFHPALTVGSPLGLQGSVTSGVLSSIRDDPTGGGFKVLQTDAAASPGNSGGPLINREGEVIGLVTYKIKGGDNLNFAIPINYLRGLMDGATSQLTLEQLQSKLAATKSDVFNSDVFPARWKSLESGTTKIVRRDGDRMYIETVLSDAAKTAGCFNLADLQRNHQVFLGTGRLSCVCQYTRGLGVYARTFSNSFMFQYKIELTTVGPTRIEGRATQPPAGSKLDCAKGAYDKPSEWETFTWIPE